RDSAGSPSSCQKAKSDSASAAVIIAQATTPAVLRENERIPIRPLMAAPRPGRSGISQMKRMVLLRIADRGLQIGEIRRRCPDNPHSAILNPHCHDLITFISSMLTVSLLR